MIVDLLCLTGGFVFALLCDAAVRLHKRRARRNAQPTRNWVVVTKAGTSHYDDKWTSNDVIVKVLPRRGGGGGFIVGGVKPDDTRFEERVAELQAEAEEQALALHAAGVR